MKNGVIIIILFLICSCQNQNSSKDNCIEYIDSLAFNIVDGKLKVAMIDLSQENNIRPYSLFYDNHLIVLNKKDSFYAFDSDCFQRDLEYERRVNSRKFKRAFIISDRLYGIDSCNQAYQFDDINSKWMQYSKQLPLFNTPPIYENEKYVCYTVCRGEFGALLFFYNKLVDKITVTLINQCVNSLIEHDGGFYIVSGFDHEYHSSDVLYIKNPDLLKELTEELNDYDKWDRALNYHDFLSSGNYYKHVFSGYQSWDKEMMTAGFRIKGKNYFLSWIKHDERWQTCLTRIKDSLTVIETPDIIFSNIRFLEGMTRKMRDRTIIDYGWRFDNSNRSLNDDEYSNCLNVSFLVNDSSLIKINWAKR